MWECGKLWWSMCREPWFFRSLSPYPCHMWTWVLVVAMEFIFYESLISVRRSRLSCKNKKSRTRHRDITSAPALLSLICDSNFPFKKQHFPSLRICCCQEGLSKLFGWYTTSLHHVDDIFKASNEWWWLDLHLEGVKKREWACQGIALVICLKRECYLFFDSLTAAAMWTTRGARSVTVVKPVRWERLCQSVMSLVGQQCRFGKRPMFSSSKNKQ